MLRQDDPVDDRPIGGREGLPASGAEEALVPPSASSVPADSLAFVEGTSRELDVANILPILQTGTHEETSLEAWDAGKEVPC